LNTIEEKIAALIRLREKHQQGGGINKIQKQHQAGKLTARERIEKLLDPDSFVEIDTFVQTEMGGEPEYPGEGVVTGYGSIDNRPVYIFAQDFTVAGGSLGELHAAKICKIMDLAVNNGAPCIGLEDSGGARIQEGVRALNGYGNIFRRNTLASGVVPQISVIMGPCAGGAVYSPAITDFIIMVDQTSQMFITGPSVIKAVTGEEVQAEALGGAMTHNQISGVAHLIAQDEEHCFTMIRELLSYLPANNLDEALRLAAEEPGLAIDDLLEIVPDNPNRSYDVREVIKRVVDGSRFFEIHPYFAQNAVVGFARINGRSVGIVANQALVLAGCLDIDSSDKIARFIRFCDCFNIPIITFVDVPGYLPGSNQEYEGIIRHGAKILYAYSEATVPLISVILRKAYGGAYIAMSSRSLGADLALAWPTAEIAVMGPEGAANIVYRKEIETAENPQEVRAKKVAEYREQMANPYLAASRGWVDDVIHPLETRRHLIRALSVLTTKQQARPRKKHGNIPF
jgi:propionyl-CoA carboxylase beta chain